MSRFFRRKKSDEEEKEIVKDTPTEDVQTEEKEPDMEEAAAEEITTEEVPVGRESTIPYHASIQDRLMYMFNDSRTGAGIEGTDEFYLEFMAMGERFWIGKVPKAGAMTDQDAHVRISNDVVAELLSAASFSEFSKIFMHYYKNAEAGKFIKIEVRKPITDLNRRGYARVPVMKLLIGSAR